MHHNGPSIDIGTYAVELRQLRYFVKIVEESSLGSAARALDVAPSALSRQVSNLESELSTRLLQRTKAGTTPTDAGIAFYRQAQLALRHVDHAAQAARQARLSGHASVGMPPSTSAVLALPFVLAMRERYPDIRLRVVEALSGALAASLNSRQLDLAIQFENPGSHSWSLTPLLNERLFVMARPDLPGWEKIKHHKRVRLAQLTSLPLILPSGSHGLRSVVNAVFARLGVEPKVAAEVDGLAVLMDAVASGLGATIQPGAATVRLHKDTVHRIEISDPGAQRRNLLASLSDDELAPAALAARVVLTDVAKLLVLAKRWPGATLPA